MVQRLTYRKRHSYATKSNQHRVVKTPGGKLVYQTTKKRASGPKCPVTGKRIQGIPHLRPAEYKRSRLSRNRRTVNRAYGGVLSGSAVRERIIRAFLVEEQKIVKKIANFLCLYLDRLPISLHSMFLPPAIRYLESAWSLTTTHVPEAPQQSNQHRVVKTPVMKTSSNCSRCACRIIGAFLVEEQRIVKKVLKIQKAIKTINLNFEQRKATCSSSAITKSCQTN
ncbi:hypothetical protein NC653_029710 [Populus alba x Populus x berolinensis]|uniref:60S ribosomal protein L34 n=1 Tax=Populus alba x Populus x berolinensis TaxID=444605 RepID=A0AAD6M333_9ROSI|nr:hypothetical protein NC653_029710 [Populus alba x Populus x berolinensis]